MVDEKIEEYCIAYSKEDEEVLKQLERETHLKTTQPQMLSGPLQGRFLTMIVRMLKARKALEIGTFTGYSSICIANGLPQDGELYTFEINEEMVPFHKKYFPLSRSGHKIRCYIQDANEGIKQLKESFDFIFIDAGKKDYASQYELLISKLNPGGAILVDNVLWKGKVLEENADKTTKQIHQFNEMVKNDDRVVNLILPIRDGINLIMKK